MPWGTFFVWKALGGLAWAMSVGLIGFTLGAAEARILEHAGLAGLLAALVVAAGVLAWIWRRRTR
jgi:membrane protein DedA with SNARE-associated domain